MEQTPAIHEDEASEPSAEGPVLLHIWMIDPARAGDHVRALSTLFRGVADEPGFISARVLESPDRASIAALIEMRTAEDRTLRGGHDQHADRLPRALWRVIRCLAACPAPAPGALGHRPGCPTSATGAISHERGYQGPVHPRTAARGTHM